MEDTNALVWAGDGISARRVGATVALDVAPLVDQDASNLEGCVVPDRVAQAVLDNAIRREIRRVEQHAKITARIMFFMGLVTGVAVGMMLAVR